MESLCETHLGKEFRSEVKRFPYSGTWFEQWLYVPSLLDGLPEIGDLQR